MILDYDECITDEKCKLNIYISSPYKVAKTTVQTVA